MRTQLLLLCVFISIVLAQNGTQIVIGQPMTGTLIAGQIQPFWINITNVTTQNFMLRLDSEGAMFTITKSEPLSDINSPNYLDFFCGGDCFNAPSAFWAIKYYTLDCPGLDGNGIYYVNVYNEFHSNTFSFTTTLFDPVLHLNTAKDYPINSLGFVVNENTVPANESLRVYTRIYNTLSTGASLSEGLQLRRSTTCNSVSPYNNNPNTGPVTSYVLSSSTNVKNTDKFYVKPSTSWYINEGSRTGGLESGIHACVVVCVDGTTGCSACENIQGSAGTRVVSNVTVVILTYLLAILVKFEH
jgi:hypothetical protein